MEIQDFEGHTMSMFALLWGERHSLNTDIGRDAFFLSFLGGAGWVGGRGDTHRRYEECVERL